MRRVIVSCLLAAAALTASSAATSAQPAGGIVLVEWSPHGPGIDIASASGTTCRRVRTLPKGTRELLVSPDGAAVAYRSGYTDQSTPLRLQRLDAGTARVLDRHVFTLVDWPNRHQLVYLGGTTVGRETVVALRVDDDPDVPARLAWPLYDAAASKPWIVRHGNVALSPDGRQIAFVREAADGASYAVAVAPADGSAADRIVFRSPAPVGFVDEVFPTWSPDGKQLAFHDVVDAGSLIRAIFVADLKTGAVSQVTHPMGGHGDTMPAWSPDGKRILFSSNRYQKPQGTLEGAETWEAYVMNADGTALRRLTFSRQRPGSENGPWSPDGAAVAFHRGHQAYVVRMDSTGTHALCAGRKKSDVYPLVWSQ